MNNMTTFYIVRHGETDWNVEGRVQGQTDIPLNVNGEMQAKALGELLRDVRFDLAFSSDLMRAKRTIEIVALEHQLEVQLTELLRERKFGEMEGKKYEAFKTYDELFEKLSDTEKYTHKHADDHESDEEIANRLMQFIRETAMTHPGKTILVGTHGGMMRVLLIKLGYFSYSRHHDQSIKNSSYVAIKTDGSEMMIIDTKGIHKKED